MALVCGARIGWLSVRCRYRPAADRSAGGLSAQHVGELQGASSDRGLHSENRVQHGDAGIGWQSVGRQSEGVLRLFDHADGYAAANGQFLRKLLRQSSSVRDSGIQRHPVWNDARVIRDGFFDQCGPAAAEVAGRRTCACRRPRTHPYDLKRHRKILHVANLTASRSNEHGSPDFDSSERDCRQNAVYSRQHLSGSTT